MIEPKIQIQFLRELIRKWELVIEQGPLDNEFSKLVKEKIKENKNEIKLLVKQYPDKVI